MRISITLFFILVLLVGGSALARNNSTQPEPGFDNSPNTAVRLLVDTAEVWPQWAGIHGTDEILASFNCFGQLGVGFWPRQVYGPLIGYKPDYPNFITPPVQDIEYLFGGLIWVGGIINGDTLVSTAGDGWEYLNEMFPHGGPNGPEPSVTREFYPADNSFHSLFYDSIPDQYVPVGQPNNPMGLRLALRSHNINSDEFNKTILYDLVVTNTSGNTIEKAYIGIFIDADVGSPALGAQASQDDFVGSIRDQALGYAYDNDGDPDPVSHEYVDGYSATRVIGLKLIGTSFNAVDTNFNWWVSNYTPTYDFGARMKGTEQDPFRDFGTGGTGTPVGDENKYYLLSHKEWDYDLVYAPYIEESDPVWLNTMPTNPGDYHIDLDSRFLLSVGPIDLMPDSSARVLFSTLTAQQFHTDPYNYINNYDNPAAYLTNLDFAGLTQSAQNADLLADSLIRPQFPVLGLREESHGDDSVRIEWDPWVFSDVTGYDIYASPVPFDMFPYPDALPPWLEPTEYNLLTHVDRTYTHLLTDLDPNRYYFVNVINNGGKAIGDPGQTLVVRSGDRYPAPQIESQYIFAAPGQPATVRWTAPDGVDIDHYNVYRIDSTNHATIINHALYDQRKLEGYYNLADSFRIGDKLYYYYAERPWAVTDAAATEIDIDPIDEQYRYYVSAVDSNGLESEFSEAAYAYNKPAKTRDVALVYAASNSHGFVNNDSLLNMYESLLSGYDYEIIKPEEYIYSPDCSNPDRNLCFDWRQFLPFKALIVDNGLTEPLMAYEDDYGWLSRYLESGGTVIYCGDQHHLSSLTYAADRPFPIPVTSSFTGKYFAIDTLYYIWPSYYLDITYPDPIWPADSLSGFIEAVPEVPSFPVVNVDTVKKQYDIPGFVSIFWPYKSAPGIVTYKVNDRGQTLYNYGSLYPQWSLFDNQPVGVKTVGDGFTTYLFGFHLWQMDTDDAQSLINTIMDDVPTAVGDDDNGPSVPNQFVLGQNYPNPFNLATNISYVVPERAHITLDVFNILGQKVRTLVDEDKPVGRYVAGWDSMNDQGETVASGIYLYRLKTDKAVLTRKMILLK